MTCITDICELCRPPLRGGGSTYCFTPVSFRVCVSISVSVRSHPTQALPAQCFFGCTKI